jgi:hypothetical protein
VAALKKNDVGGGRISLPAQAVSEPPPPPLMSSISTGAPTRPPADLGDAFHPAAGDDTPPERKAKEKKSKKDTIKKAKKAKSDFGVTASGGEDGANATTGGSLSCGDMTSVPVAPPPPEASSGKKREKREKRASRKSVGNEITHAIIAHANAGSLHASADDTPMTETPSLATSTSPPRPAPPSPPKEDKEEDKGKPLAHRTVVQPFTPPAAAGHSPLPEPTRQAPERPSVP